MRILVHCPVLWLLVVLPTPSSAELPELAAAAFARSEGSSGGWAYTRSSVENGKTAVERFEPSDIGDGWTLVEVGGKAPSNKQLKKYAAASEGRITREHPGEIDFDDLVAVDSVALVSETTTSATFSFDPAPDTSDDDDPSAYLDGILVVDKTRRYVTSLELANTESLSPATGVKINKMRVQMGFELDQQERVVLRKLSQLVDGRLFGIKRINQESTVTYSEFAGPP